MNLKIIIILLILLCYPVSASVPDLDISSILPSLISQGGNAFIESLGDQLYHMGAVNNASEAQGKIAVYMGEKNNFVTRKGVQEQKDFNAFWFMVFYILYAGYGAARISGENGNITTGFTTHESYNRTYIKTLVLGLLFFIFYLYGIDWLCTVEWLIAKGFTMNALSIMPDGTQRGIVYLIIAIVNVGIWIFMQFRDIVVYMVIMYLLWLVCMRNLPMVGYAVYFILSFGVTLFFSRIIIAFLFMSGAIAIETLGLGGIVIPYLILMGVIIMVCFVISITPLLMTYRKIMGTKHMIRR